MQLVDTYCYIVLITFHIVPSTIVSITFGGFQRNVVEMIHSKHCLGLEYDSVDSCTTIKSCTTKNDLPATENTEDVPIYMLIHQIGTNHS